MNVRPIEGPLGLPGGKRSHPFPRWQRCSQSEFANGHRLEFAFAVNPYESADRTGLGREQLFLWFAGYPKRRAAVFALGYKLT